VEHPYGTIKRQWGFSYIMTRSSLKRAGADVGLMMTAYNLRRIINILGMERLREFLQDRLALFFNKTAVMDRVLDQIRALFRESHYWNLGLILPVKRLHSIQIPTPGRGF
jgi:hypothetical protein